MTTLFEPFDLAGTTLQNRVVMAPLTRSRAPHDIADERVALYYAQRATAGLIVSEGTPISREGQGYLFNPGIFTPAQVAGWKLVTDSVRALGGRMFAQIWHVGRVSHPTIQNDGKLPVSPSSRQPMGAQAFGFDADGQPGLVAPPAPRQLETNEIPRIVSDFAQAAENAIAAGFDGVEIHGANGYLFEQFMNPLVNDRTDQYSGDTLENRLRFTLEVIDAVVARIGAHRTGIRISPYGQLFDMPVHAQIDETYTALVKAIGERELAYLHVMDQSGFAMGETKVGAGSGFGTLLASFKPLLPKTAVILAGGMTRELAERLIADNVIDLAAFGKSFISNPDLVARLRNDWALTPPDQTTFYGGDAKGYVDYAPYKA
jgi:2,4-dienoyl-CoA reductase-like NADH-dependent reductase (Old Yellow Enzyme family)